MANDPTFDYDDVVIQVKTVKYKGARFLLTEATESASRVYRGMATRSLRLVDGKVSGIGSEIADIQAAVVHECLFETQGNDGTTCLMSGQTPVKVPLERIQKMPTRIVKEMFDWIKRVSDLDEKEQSPDDIRKTIASLQDKLAKLEGDSGPKALSDGSTQTSDSAQG